jgi:hypothetical protein
MTEKIKLTLDRENYLQLLRRYSLEELKVKAVDMAMAQFSERPVTEEMLYSVLSNLESDLAGMFA